MEGQLSPLLAASPVALLIAIAADLAIGDPVYRWHPIRLMGAMLTWIETRLRAVGLDGYGGGIALFAFLAVLWGGGLVGLVLATSSAAAALGWVVHVFVLYSMLAMGDLLRHVWRVDSAVARSDLDGARAAVALLVGRDTAPMDGAACRRAAIESLGESFTDGFLSPLFWYALLGLPGIVLFKIASTMDSMVGYKTPRYLRFGWFGARLDDVMNFAPARVSWLLIALAALVVPGCSARRAFVAGLGQHALLPGPNAGWSEAATAGAIRRRLVGPIWRNGQIVTDIWIGNASDPAAGTGDDVRRAVRVVVAAGTIGVAAVMAATM